MTTTTRWRPDPPADLKPAGLCRRARIALAVWLVASALIVGWVLFASPTPNGGGPACGTDVEFSGPNAEADAFSRARSCDLAEQEQRWVGMWLIAAIGLGAIIVVRLGRWRANGQMEPLPPDPGELRPPDGFRERALAGPADPPVDGQPPRAPQRSA